jgi:DNA polymerase delta subunit 3
MPDAPAATDEPSPEELNPVESEQKPEPKEEITVQGGRRRGRRQVMKKKTVKDEEGYLGWCDIVLKIGHILIVSLYSYDRRACVGVVL